MTFCWQIANERRTTQTVRLGDGEKTAKATVRISLLAGETIQIMSGYGIRVKWTAENSTEPVTNVEAQESTVV